MPTINSSKLALHLYRSGNPEADDDFHAHVRRMLPQQTFTDLCDSRVAQDSRNGYRELYPRPSRMVRFVRKYERRFERLFRKAGL